MHAHVNGSSSYYTVTALAPLKPLTFVAHLIRSGRLFTYCISWLIHTFEHLILLMLMENMSPEHRNLAPLRVLLSSDCGMHMHVWLYLLHCYHDHYHVSLCLDLDAHMLGSLCSSINAISTRPCFNAQFKNHTRTFIRSQPLRAVCVLSSMLPLDCSVHNAIRNHHFNSQWHISSVGRKWTLLPLKILSVHTYRCSCAPLERELVLSIPYLSMQFFLFPTSYVLNKFYLIIKPKLIPMWLYKCKTQYLYPMFEKRKCTSQKLLNQKLYLPLEWH